MSTPPPPPVLVVGAGLSGLACAVTLHEAGIPVQVVEASDGVGGRVRTDLVDGFLLDRGFQVYLSAYPQSGALLDLPALDLRPFEPGALAFKNGELHRVMDVFRRPASALESAFAPIGSLADKLRVALLRFRAIGSSDEEISARADQKTETFLQRRGFSAEMIDGFFRAFYGGIFLERDLRTSSRMFEFTFKMFSEGSATLPAHGMGQIPLQLAKRLPPEAIRLRSAVASASAKSILLPSGEEILGSKVVIATQAPQTARLIPSFSHRQPTWRSVTNLYFSADHSPLKEAIIALNTSGKGLINNLSVPSDVAPNYAPENKSLISISLLGIHQDLGTPEAVKSELQSWFGDQALAWTHLRSDIIKHALPEQPPHHATPEHLEIDGFHICGDHTSSASIEGAISSGLKTARRLIDSR